MPFAWNRAAFALPATTSVQLAAFLCRYTAKRGLQVMSTRLRISRPSCARWRDSAFASAQLRPARSARCSGLRPGRGWIQERMIAPYLRRLPNSCQNCAILRQKRAMAILSELGGPSSPATIGRQQQHHGRKAHERLRPCKVKYRAAANKHTGHHHPYKAHNRTQQWHHTQQQARQHRPPPETPAKIRAVCRL